MKAPKVTQGQWQTVTQSGIPIGVGVEVKSTHGSFYHMACNSILPDSNKSWPREKETVEANMKLIAAAPELAEALNEAYEILDKDPFNCAIANKIRPILLKAGYTE